MARLRACKFPSRCNQPGVFVPPSNCPIVESPSGALPYFSAWPSSSNGDLRRRLVGRRVGLGLVGLGKIILLRKGRSVSASGNQRDAITAPDVSCCRHPFGDAPRERERLAEIVTHHLVNDPDHQTATGAHGDVVGLVLQVGQGDLEAVAAWARVVVGLQRLVVRHVLDLYLVVDGYLLIVRHFGCVSGAAIAEAGMAVWRL